MSQQDGSSLRAELASLLDFKQPACDESVVVEIQQSEQDDGYTRQRVRYASEAGDLVWAFLLIPDGHGPHPGIVVHHQHASQWHLGKSEVAGLAGDQWQAFGPTLARDGFVVLAPDALAFEDRRGSGEGTTAHTNDWNEHYNHMTYRVLAGSSLMAATLADAAKAMSVLGQHEAVDAQRCGILGHSMGGNTVLFQASVDERVTFAVASGCAASFKAKMRSGTAIEMSEIIPGFCERFDVADLLVSANPIPYLVCSGSEDPYSEDGDDVVVQVRARTGHVGEHDGLTSSHDTGGHALNRRRFETIVSWLSKHNGMSR